MSWLTLALGLIREAATTEMGQDILKDIRSGGSKRESGNKTRGADAASVEAWMQSVENRLTVTDRNTEMLVRMLNSQDETFVKIQKRQRIWNLALALAIVLTAAAVAWLGFR